MKKYFSSHQFFNEKNDVRFLLRLRCISMLIMILFIYIPLQGFSHNGPGHNKLTPGNMMKLAVEKGNKFDFNDIRITGTVRDEKGNPMIGVSVIVVGQTTGVSTDNNGSFSISVPPNAQLRLSYIGYTTMTVSVSGRTHIDIALTPDVSSLNAVVVTALGIKREERSLGYSVGQVSGKDLTEVNHENVLTGLAGKVPGVSISSTGGTGSSVSMVHFIIAEAKAVNGWTSADAEKEYYEGIRASLEAWGLSSAYSDYITQPDVVFDNTQKQIMEQKWIANWTNSTESWFDFRRTGFPELHGVQGRTIAPELPIRFYYPKSEQNLNSDNEQAAADKLEVTNYSGFGADGNKNSPWSKMWLLQGTGKPW